MQDLEVNIKENDRSEYWKSQPRKFCDFCKCWITDNKPSVEFHEKGKRHQENVKLRIQEVRKKGTEAAKRKEEENDYMRQMEKAALEAFKKDLEGDPDLARQYNVKLPEVGPQLPPPGYVPPKEEEPEKEAEAKEEKKEEKKTDEVEWYEAMSDMGYPYYWNTLTGASVWVAPEKYVSLAEQGLAPPTEENGTDTDKEVKKEEEVSDIPLPPGVDEIPLPGETAPDSPPSPPSPSESSSEEEEEVAQQDRNARGVYGTWARVQKEEPEFVDLQLPKAAEVQEVIQIPVPEETKVKFKEKRITSLGSNKSGPVAFKKRKLGDGARNVRKRGGDDD